jgi:transcriptional regulator with XRE-family HTH domain
MPKKPRQVNQLRRLRTDVLKMTQPQFARLIGVSASMLQAVELGVRRVTEDFANRVAYATGVDPECLLQECPELRTVMGTPYLSSEDAKINREKMSALVPLSEADLASFGAQGALQFQDSFTSWKNLAGIRPTDVTLYGQMLGHSVELLLRAAAQGNPLKAYAIGHSLARWLHRTAQEFDVIRHMESLLAERGEVPSQAPFLNDTVLDRDPSMEWLFYQGQQSSVSKPDPAYAELAARGEARRRDRFRWYGKRMAKPPARTKRPV